MSERVVVLGRNFTSRLGMIRAAGQAGCDVTVINTEHSGAGQKDPVDFSSKYVREYYYAPEPDAESLIRVLRDRCKSDPPEKTIIIPTDDYTASVIDRHQPELADDFLFPHIRHEAGAAVRCMDKEYQKELAKKAGLPVARGWTATFDGERFSVPSDVVFPCFVKPQVSFQGSKFYMKRCVSAEDLKTHLDKIAADLAQKGKSTDLLIEEYITIEKEYDIPGFTNGDEVVMPLFIEKGIIHLGVTGSGTLLSSRDFQDVTEKLKAFVKSTGFVGLTDIELLESNGTIFFNELNMRFGASGFAATGAGINLPRLLIDHLQGVSEPSHSVWPSFEGKRFASEKVCFQEYRDRRIDWREFIETINGQDFTFIRDEDDGKPFRAFWKTVKVFRFKRQLKKLLLGKKL